MIQGKLKDIPQILPYVNASLQKALHYLATTDFSTLPNGNYEIEGKDIYAGVNTYMTEPKADRKPEKHRTYTDVQFMGRGKETIWYSSVADQDVMNENYLDERDVCFYAGAPEDNCVNLEEGDFAVFFPWEIHRPNCTYTAGTPEEVQKIVVKVKSL